MLLYRIAYWAGMIWAAVGAFSLTLTHWVTAESSLETKWLAIGILLGPCAILWIGRRLVTGRWL
jgi:hypothetical protein